MFACRIAPLIIYHMKYKCITLKALNHMSLYKTSLQHVDVVFSSLAEQLTTVYGYNVCVPEVLYTR